MDKELERYLPELLKRQLATDPAAIAAPAALSKPAAVLFADISGFTSLAERLAARGPAGAEELTRYLNTYFGELIDLVGGHGGDVIKFAGDALLACWIPPADETLAQAARRAAQCGLAVQQKLNDYPVGDGNRLSLRVVIGSGQLHLSDVGGVLRRWEMLAWGEPIRQLGPARSAAPPGTLVASRETWALIEDVTVGAVVGTGAGEGAARIDSMRTPLPPRSLERRPVPAEVEASLLEHIPGAILTRLNTGDVKWLGELRRVVVLFAKFPVFADSAPPAEVAGRTDQFMRAFQDAIYRYEGNVNKISIDEKGVMLLAVWGLPPLSHEDDPARAVRAALAVQIALQAIDASCSIGIASGQVYCGVIGNATRGEYTVIGDAVNLAARLMDAASATHAVWCDATIWQKSREALEFEALPEIPLKGKAKLIPVYRPTGRVLERVLDQAAIVGRVEERKVIAELLSAIQRNRDGGVIILEGEPGVGKSRLVADMRERAARLSLKLLMGAGSSIEQATPYFAWRPVFSQLFSLAAHDTPQGKREAVLALLGEDRGLAPLLDSLLSLDIPETELTRQMTGEGRANNTQALLVRLLHRASMEAPLVVALEDCHWLDSASWALLRLVHRDAGQVALVLATRPLPDPLPSEYVYLLRAHDARHLRLDTLDAAQTLELVCQRLGVRSLPEAVGKLILARAEGNPLFSEELAYALRDGGLLRIENGECHLALGPEQLRDLQLPDTVQGIVTSRVDRLVPAQQMTLKVASVVGRNFALDILHDIHPVGEDRARLAELLGPLVELEIIRPAPEEERPSYIFKHSITEEAVYNLMLFSQRRELHRAAAEWIERRHAEDVEPYLPLLAHHWKRAEDWPKAVEYFERAAGKALEQFANQAAITFLTEAQTLAERHGVAADARRLGEWEQGLASAWHGMGDLGRCAAHSYRALALLRLPAATSLAAKVFALFFQIFARIAQSLFPKRFLARLPEERTRRLQAVRLHNRLTEIAIYREEPIPLLYSGLRELNLAEPAGPSRELGRAYAIMSVVLDTIPMRGVADTWQRRGLENAQGTEQQAERAYILSRCAIHGMTGGAAWREVEGWLREAMEVSDRLGDGRLHEEAMVICALALFYEGQYARSAGLMKSLHAAASLRQAEQTTGWGLMGLGMNYVRLGRAEEAVPLFDKVMPWVVDKATKADKSWGYAMGALAAERAGDHARARDLADRALAVVYGARPVAYWTHQAHSALCEVYWLLHEREQDPAIQKQLAVRLGKAVKGMRSFAGVFPFGGPLAAYWDGSYQAVIGKPEAAIAAWRRCLAIAEALAMPFEQGLAQREIGLHLAATDPARGEHLARARALLAGCGAAYDLARLPAAPGSDAAPAAGQKHTA